MDFVHNVLAGARTIRILTAIDAFTRECGALVALPQFRGDDVAAARRPCESEAPASRSWREWRVLLANGHLTECR